MTEAAKGLLQDLQDNPELVGQVAAETNLSEAAVRLSLRVAARAVDAAASQESGPADHAQTLH